MKKKNFFFNAMNIWYSDIKIKKKNLLKKLLWDPGIITTTLKFFIKKTINLLESSKERPFFLLKFFKSSYDEKKKVFQNSYYE